MAPQSLPNMTVGTSSGGRSFSSGYLCFASSGPIGRGGATPTARMCRRSTAPTPPSGSAHSTSWPRAAMARASGTIGWRCPSIAGVVINTRIPRAACDVLIPESLTLRKARQPSWDPGRCRRPVARSLSSPGKAVSVAHTQFPDLAGPRRPAAARPACCESAGAAGRWVAGRRGSASAEERCRGSVHHVEVQRGLGTQVFGSQLDLEPMQAPPLPCRRLTLPRSWSVARFALSTTERNDRRATLRSDCRSWADRDQLGQARKRT